MNFARFKKHSLILGYVEPDFTGIRHFAEFQCFKQFRSGRALHVGRGDDGFGVGLAHPASDPLGEDDLGGVIDDVRLLRSNSVRAERSGERERAEVSAGIKDLARELGIPILVLADLNRRTDFNGKSEGRRISDIADFRNSEAIGQNADIVGWLYRTNYDAQNAEEREAEAGRAELIVVKNRNGKSGWVPLLFIEDLMRFETCPPEPLSSNLCEADEIREAWESHRDEEVDEREDSINAEC